MDSSREELVRLFLEKSKSSPVRGQIAQEIMNEFHALSENAMVLKGILSKDNYRNLLTLYKKSRQSWKKLEA